MPESQFLRLCVVHSRHLASMADRMKIRKTFNAYCQVKRLPILQFQLRDKLEKAKPQRQEKDQWLQTVDAAQFAECLPSTYKDPSSALHKLGMVVQAITPISQTGAVRSLRYGSAAQRALAALVTT